VAARDSELVAEVPAARDQYAARAATLPATTGETESGEVTVAEGGAGVLIVVLPSARSAFQIAVCGKKKDPVPGEPATTPLSSCRTAASTTFTMGAAPHVSSGRSA
jgi:hypothetical protein